MMFDNYKSDFDTFDHPQRWKSSYPLASKAFTFLISLVGRAPSHGIVKKNLPSGT
jgi:hypothetical protein